MRLRTLIALACTGLVPVMTAPPASATGYEVVYTTGCPGTTYFPKPPTGPWIQAVHVCGLRGDAYVIAYGPNTYCSCIAIYSPYFGVEYRTLTLRTTIDGVTTITPLVVLPSGRAETPYPICLYTNDPFHPAPCLL